MGEDRWLKLVPCPACGVPAEVTGRFRLPGTSGPVDHLELRCALGHHFRMPVDLLSCRVSGSCWRRKQNWRPSWWNGRPDRPGTPPGPG
jgi:hypothetical protein